MKTSGHQTVRATVDRPAFVAQFSPSPLRFRLLRGQEAEPFTFTFNGQDFHFDEVLVDNGIIEVPVTDALGPRSEALRLLERVGAEITPTAEGIRIERPGRSVEFRVGSRFVFVDGEEQPMPATIRRLRDGVVFLPLRFLMESFGASTVAADPTTLNFVYKQQYDVTK